MNVDDAFDALQAAGDYQINVTGRTKRGRPRKLATIIGSPGTWRMTSEHYVSAALGAFLGGDEARGATMLDRHFQSVAESVLMEDDCLPLRGEIAWPVVSFVCDVVHAHDGHSLAIDALKDVAQQHGSRIANLEEIPLTARVGAAEILRLAVGRAVVLPSE